MATTKVPLGAIPANTVNGTNGDPFTSGAGAGTLRYASLDPDSFSSSPAHAKRALEAHLKDTDRRIQDASRLGTTLLQQRKDLAARLEDVKQVQNENDEVPDDLRKRLVDLEKEYEEVGRESARAFLPGSARKAPNAETPAVLSGGGRESPTKVSASSRRQRNQPANRTHDIEFATEISTSLLSQVRHYQALLAEKDDVLQASTSRSAQMEAEAGAMIQRIKSMDEEGQRYKDENWNLQICIQELESQLRDTTQKHDKAVSGLKSTESEKAAKERELDEVKAAHEKLQEDHSALARQHEAEAHTLRRDLTAHQTEKEGLAMKVDELTSQNTELARGLSYRFNQPGHATKDGLSMGGKDPTESDEAFADPSEPSSPVKGTPARHGMLESETLKSSLNHAHRMIQNLKNNIHREKTEKLELKRMLQESRDELELRRSDGSGIGANVAKKRRSDQESGKSKKPAPRGIGANRSSVTEVIEDEDEPDWEDHDGERTPSKSRTLPSTATFDHAAFGGAKDTETPDATDAFETANERDTTENEAFETGAEDLPNSEDDLTETESGVAHSRTVRSTPSSTSLIGRTGGDRRSYLSTASTSGDEADEVRTPAPAGFAPKYKLRMNGRGGRRPSGRVGDLVVSDSPVSRSAESPGALASPTSSQGTPQQAGGQTLGDELEGFDEGTPNSVRSSEEPQSPETVTGSPSRFGAEAVEENAKPKRESAVLAHQAYAAMLADESTVNKVKMVDACVGTDPWTPEAAVSEDAERGNKTLMDRAEGIVGGALAGFGLGRLRRDKQEDGGEAEGPPAVDGAEAEIEEREEVTSESQVPEDDAITEQEPKSLSVAPFEHSAIVSQETEPVTPPRPVTARATSGTGVQDIADDASIPTVPLAATAATEEPAKHLPESLTFSAIEAQDSEPAKHRPEPLTFSAIEAQDSEPAKHRPEPLTFSAIETQDLAPIDLPDIPTPLVPKRSSRRLDALYSAGEPDYPEQDFSGRGLPGTDGARPGAAFLTGSLPHPAPLVRSRSKSMPASQNEVDGERSVIEPKVFGGVRKGSSGIPTLVFGDESDEGEARETHIPLLGNLRAVGSEPEVKPLQISKKDAVPVAMADEGSQTVISGSDIDDLLRNKSRTSSMATSLADTLGPAPKQAGTPTRRSVEGAPTTDSALFAGAGAAAGRGPRRPGSSGSMRSKAAERIPPPLPEDYTQKIAAVKGPATPGAAGTMGPPLMPASAYRQKGSKTPVEYGRSMSRDGTTPRPVRHRDSRGHMQSPAGISRRTSVSSFASELDERFNITRGDLMYPSDVLPSTDPRMIQAITQTMIGEFLWKYTRKAGRSETSSTRHRRFFWVHPYTRTLYWSESDPSTAGRNMLKAKSMGITSVRVVTDDNAYPPGLHRKSIVVVTPGREIVFTAPTGQRHETWFNALSYLLLRTEQEKAEALDTMNQDDLDEFNPGGFSIRRSISRMTGGRDQSVSRSRLSLSSYNSRTTRTSSPLRQVEAQSSLTSRQSQAALRARGTTTPTLAPPAATIGSAPQLGTPTSRTNTARDSGSISGRLSSITSRFRPGSSQRGSFSTSRGRPSFSLRSRNPADPSEIYDASVVGGDSAEDLRAVIERQEREEGGRIENVRSCCDGKHDVGSLHKSGRHASFASRLGNHGHNHSHNPGHAQRSAEPMQDSQRPRRGE